MTGMSFRQARPQTTLATTAAESLQRQLSRNAVFQQIWRDRNCSHTIKFEPNANDDFNAVTTLPAILEPREVINRRIASENQLASPLMLKLKQNAGYVKTLLAFYKSGVTNVVRNRALSKRIRNKYSFEDVQTRGRVEYKVARNGADLVGRVKEVQSLGAIETSVISGENSNDAKEQYVVNLKRSEMKIVLRTENDFFKIPVFVVVLAIFMEMTPLLCYLIPEITPSTCVLPSVLKKLHLSQSLAFKELAKLRLERYDDEFAKGEIPLRFNYENVPLDELIFLTKGLKLTNRYIPVGLYPESVLRQRLQRKVQELEVDATMLLRNGGLWKLGRQELLVACLERGLIDLDHVEGLETIGIDEMRVKLALQLSIGSENVIGNVNVYGLNYLNRNTSPSFRDYTKEEIELIK